MERGLGGIAVELGKYLVHEKTNISSLELNVNFACNEQNDQKIGNFDTFHLWYSSTSF